MFESWVQQKFIILLDGVAEMSSLPTNGMSLDPSPAMWWVGVSGRASAPRYKISSLDILAEFCEIIF